MSSRLLPWLAALTALTVGCSNGLTPPSRAPAPPAASTTAAGSGKPTAPQRLNVYAASAAGKFTAGVDEDRPLVFVPHNRSGDVWVIDPATYHVLRFISTGIRAHGLFLARDAARLFVSNRSEGSISVLDAYTGVPIALWRLPGGGSPDMGNVTADGAQLWVSDRYNNVVYVVSTTDGTLLHTIKVGNEPHGLTVWPQPGRYSLGHTGIAR